MDDDLSSTLTGIAVSLVKINTKLETNTELTQKVADAIYGTNGEGLKTKVALNRSSIKRAWWWLGGISMSIIGGAVWIIRAGLK